MTHPLDKLLLNVEQPSRMILRSPTGRPLVDKEGKQAFIDVYSRDSPIAKKHLAGIDDKATDKDRVVMFLAALTAGWYLVGADGGPIDCPFSPENARDLYAHPGGIDVADQVSEHSQNRANYSPVHSQA